MRSVYPRYTIPARPTYYDGRWYPSYLQALWAAALSFIFSKVIQEPTATTHSDNDFGLPGKWGVQHIETKYGTGDKSGTHGMGEFIDDKTERVRNDLGMNTVGSYPIKRLNRPPNSMSSLVYVGGEYINSSYSPGVFYAKTRVAISPNSPNYQYALRGDTPLLGILVADNHHLCFESASDEVKEFCDPDGRLLCTLAPCKACNNLRWCVPGLRGYFGPCGHRTDEQPYLTSRVLEQSYNYFLRTIWETAKIAVRPQNPPQGPLAA